MDVTLKVKKYKTEGDIAWEYNPLRNIKKEDGSIVDFQVDNDSLNISLENPIDIECQQSYDGSVNLILNDDINPPRIINNRITLLEDNKYKIINRNQTKQSNIYNIDKLDQETRLFRNIQKIPKIKLNKVSTFGQLKGGNYIFYLKYLDSDYNETDIVAETGIISVFNGTLSNPKTCSGAFIDENTDKSIILSLYNIDTSFTYFNLYCLRNSCDQNGVLKQETYKIDHNYEISAESQLVTITGFEDTKDITIEDLNIQYNYVESVKTQTQVQNMLFFANVQKNEDQSAELRNLSLHIIATEAQSTDNIGFIDPKNFSTNSNLDESQTEYYSPQNIYYKLGYFPGELYRFGIVYIFNDDHLSPTYNLRGVDYNYINDQIKNNFEFKNKIEEIEFSDFLDKTKFENTGGVFRFSKDKKIIQYSTDNNKSGVYPLGIKFTIPSIVIEKLKKLNIKGYFFVRQKRIPNFLAQGFSIGVDFASNTPTLRNGSDANGNPIYQSESFINKSRVLNTDYNSRKIESNTISSSGLLCIDSYVDKQLQSLFNGSNFKLVLDTKFKNNLNSFKTRIFYPEYDSNNKNTESNSELIYIDSEIPQRILDDYGFSTKAGMQEDIKQIVCFGKEVTDDKKYTKYIRGIFTSFVGTKDILEDNCIYNIYKGNYSEVFLEEYFTIRIRDNSPFYAISDRYALIDSEVEEYTETKSIIEKCPIWVNYNSDYLFYRDLREYIKNAKENNIGYNNQEEISQECINYGITLDELNKYNNSITEYINNINLDEITDFELKKDYNSELLPKYYSYITNISLNRVPNTYRGDCFTATVCTRMHRNFTSTTVPINDTIVDPNCWKDNFKGARSTEDWDAINKADIDAVPIGTWFIYKCLSNSNIGLRSKDTFNVDEYSLMGNARSFYPLSDISIKSSAKIPETSLLNSGYNTTLGVKRSYAFEVIPYIKDIYDTRIMFSNIQVDGSFKNSYKVFQGLSYEDMDRQYGGIVKILPWENNILCVFEHAITIIPVNEKALIQTTQGQNIHMYGAGVLQKQMTIISDIYGSSWKDSIIRTPRGLYGVDTYAKKIWKITNKGFELISEFNIQKFLNDNINLQQLDKSVILGVRNVKTHFNAYKNDVMFTFYNRDKIWNICYNEIRNMWVTRYSWTPFFSGNLYNSYFSFDLSKTKIYGILNNNLRKQSESILVPMSPWTGMWEDVKIKKDLRFILNSDYNGFNITEIKINGFYWDSKTNGLQNELLLYLNCDNNYNIDNFDNERFNVIINNVIKPEIKLDDNDHKSYWYLNGEWLLKDGQRVEFDKDHEEASNENGWYLSHLKTLDVEPSTISFKPKNDKYLYYIINITYIPYLIASYEGTTDNEYKDNRNEYLVFAAERSYDVGLLLPEDQLDVIYQNDWRNALVNNIYLHGRAGIIDEVNYTNPNSTNKIFPTKWYNKQEPFELEFVVNTPQGIHKIFDNLVIISNNVEPESLEIEIIGDVYDFNKEKLYKEGWDNTFPIITLADGSKKYETKITWDNVTNEYSLIMHQDCINIKDYGKRLGNIYYNHDVWYTVIQPIYYKEDNILKSARVRDKYAKIRIKYSGKQLVTISALQTLMTQSYV